MHHRNISLESHFFNFHPVNSIVFIFSIKFHFSKFMEDIFHLQTVILSFLNLIFYFNIFFIFTPIVFFIIWIILNFNNQYQFDLFLAPLLNIYFATKFNLSFLSFFFIFFLLFSLFYLIFYFIIRLYEIILFNFSIKS